MKNWEDLVLETAERFGGTFPHPDTSTAIAAVHQRAPNAVQHTIDEVANDYSKGNINSPWGILRSRVSKITADVHAKATTSNQREKAIARAEQRVRNELIHYDRQDEILDELFGPRGTLRDHDSPETRGRLLDLWQQLRPLGELTEHQATERGLRYQGQRAALANTKPAGETQDQRIARQKQLAAQKAHPNP